MRDSLDIQDGNSMDLAPLIPDPPIKRRRPFRRQGPLHRCWGFFAQCSRWTCILVSVAFIVLILIVCRELLPFGWPNWWPSIKYSSSDPHIILIVADDLGWNDVGYGHVLQDSELYSKYGFRSLDPDSNSNSNTEIETETNINLNQILETELDGSDVYFSTKWIDTLAESGVVLNRFYVSLEGSSSRASILTGHNGYRLGLQNGIESGSNAHIPIDIETLSEVLSNERHYSTHLIGKWNLGYGRWKYTPLERGFDSFIGFHQSWMDYWHYTSSESSIDNENRVGWDLWNDKSVYELGVSERKFATEFFSERIGEVISSHANGDTPDRPLFVMFTAPNPHTPLQVHQNFDSECSGMGTTLRTKQCNIVQHFDYSVGKIVESLKNNNMYERSLIVVVSDNGGLICYNVGDEKTCSGSSNAPLRAGKKTLFDGGLRTRAFMSGGYIPKSKQGTITDTFMMHSDLFPTILSAANVDKQLISDLSVDGINHYSLLLEDNENSNDIETDDDDNFNSRQTGILEVMVDDDNNLMRGAIIDWPYKYIVTQSEPYDGWYESPLDKSFDLPENSRAYAGKFDDNNGETVGKITTIKDFELYSSGENTETNLINTYISQYSDGSDLEYHEYLFDIDTDPSESGNLYELNPDKVGELRGTLLNIVNSQAYQTPQDSTTNADSCPSNFGNIWYPFHEKFHH